MITKKTAFGAKKNLENNLENNFNDAVNNNNIDIDLFEHTVNSGKNNGSSQNPRRKLNTKLIGALSLVLVFVVALIIGFSFVGETKTHNDNQVMAQIKGFTGYKIGSIVEIHGLKVWEGRVYDAYNMPTGMDSDLAFEQTIIDNIDAKTEAEIAKKMPKSVDFVSQVVAGDVSLSYMSNGSVHKNPEAKKMVAITFDDGPFTNWTGKYLDVLAEYDVKATFFTLGQYVKNRPEAAQKIVEAGHEIGTHSWYHHKLPSLTANDLEEDFRKTDEAFKEVLGFSPYLFRAPYGAVNHDIRAKAKEYGKISVMWSLDPLDWKVKSANTVYERVMGSVKSGDIILLHENKPSTLEALPKIIKGLQEKGYKLVTVSELLYQSSDEVKSQEVTTN